MNDTKNERRLPQYPEAIEEELTPLLTAYELEILSYIGHNTLKRRTTLNRQAKCGQDTILFGLYEILYHTGYNRNIVQDALTALYFANVLASITFQCNDYWFVQFDDGQIAFDYLKDRIDTATPF